MFQEVHEELLGALVLLSYSLALSHHCLWCVFLYLILERIRFPSYRKHLVTRRISVQQGNLLKRSEISWKGHFCSYKSKKLSVQPHLAGLRQLNKDEKQYDLRIWQDAPTCWIECLWQPNGLLSCGLGEVWGLYSNVWRVITVMLPSTFHQLTFCGEQMQRKATWTPIAIYM